jgi:hypothetical protein
VAVLQSNYLPWKGYFDIIADVELFVFYDDVQFTKNDWRNRNRIKTPAGSAWITVPVGQDIRRAICEVELPGDSRWAEKHWRTLQQNYSRAAHFGQYRAFFEETYLGRRWTHLSALNRHLIEAIARDFLGCKTRFADSRDYDLSGRKGDRLLGLLTALGAERYVTGPSARSYIDDAKFREAGVQVIYKSYEGYPEYPQFHPPFDHYVSVVDLLFHTGPRAPHYIWGWRNA